MCKKLIFLISFVLVLSLAGSVSAIPFETAAAVWNFDPNDVTADEMGPPYSVLSDYYYCDTPRAVTGAETAEHWDGWAAPSCSAWWSPMYYGEQGDEIRPLGAVTFLVRTYLSDPFDLADDGFIVLTGMYDGGCGVESEKPSYGIEIVNGEPFFVVTSFDFVRVAVGLGYPMDPNTWYDLVGRFDPDNDTLSITIADSATGYVIGEASAPVAFDDLYYTDNAEWEIFCSPCYILGAAEGDGLVELVAIWIGAVEVLKGVMVSNPNPADGEEGVHCDVNTVCFQPPSNAWFMYDPCDPCDRPPDPNMKGPFDFYVHFSEDPCVMPQIAEFTNVDTCDVMCVDVGTTVPGVTYYWSVDVNDQNAPGDPCFYEGPTFDFTKWGYAMHPLPYDGATDQSLYVTLSWEPDGYAASYDVYFGTDESAVAHANDSDLTGIFRGNQLRGFETYIPQVAPTASFTLGTTYYWRIDEVNDFNGAPFPVKGHVLRFTTGYWDLIEDFESYASTGKLNDVWRDYTSKGPEKEDPTNAAAVVLVTDPDPLISGLQSMKYVYEWPYASEPKHCTVRRTFDSPQDWTTMGVASLVLWFYGDANDGEADPCFADGMSVTLVDWDDDQATIAYAGDASDLIAKEWMQWPLSFQDFNELGNVNPEKIKQVEIHIIGGSFGQMWFDDVRRYAPICFEDYAPDITRDCIWNEEDLAVMAEDWLDYDYTVPAEALIDANLLVHYVFDDVNGLNDVSGAPYYHGVAVNDVNVHDGILTLNNLPMEDTNDVNAVDIPFGAANPFDGTRDYSIVMEFRTTSSPILMSSSKADPCAITTSESDYDHAMGFYMAEVYESEEVLSDNCMLGWMGAGTGLADGEWHVVVTTYDAETTAHHVYADCQPESWAEGGDPIANEWDPNIPNIAEDTVRIGSSYNPDTFASGGDHLIGDINEVRIYDRVLSHGEVVDLMGLPDCYVPLVSDADLYEEAINSMWINFKDYAILADKWLEEQLFGE